MNHNALRSLKIFLQFLYRDFYIQRAHITTHLINYSFLYPILYTFSFAFMQTEIYFHGQQRLGAVVFAGTCLVPILVMTFHLSFELLFDLGQNRHTDYQITILNPRLLICEQILFCSLFTFCIVIPYFPIGYVLAYSLIDLQNISWPCTFLILYLGCLCAASYNKLAVMFLRINTISTLWTRINNPLQAFGGFFIPSYVIQAYSPTLGFITRLNPLMYLTEGTRQALVGGPDFLPIWQCAFALILMSIAFTALTCYFFKKRVDHI